MCVAQYEGVNYEGTNSGQVLQEPSNGNWDPMLSGGGWAHQINALIVWNGDLVAATGDRFDVDNPADGTVQIYNGNTEDSWQQIQSGWAPVSSLTVVGSNLYAATGNYDETNGTVQELITSNPSWYFNQIAQGWASANTLATIGDNLYVGTGYTGSNGDGSTSGTVQELLGADGEWNQLVTGLAPVNATITESNDDLVLGVGYNSHFNNSALADGGIVIVDPDGGTTTPASGWDPVNSLANGPGGQILAGAGLYFPDYGASGSIWLSDDGANTWTEMTSCDPVGQIVVLPSGEAQIVPIAWDEVQSR